MKTKSKALFRTCLIAAGVLTGSAATRAQDIITWTAASGDLFTAANWDLNLVPGIGNIILINNAGTATIAADAGTHALAAIRLGDVQDDTVSGHIIMNGGTLNLGGTAGDPKAVIGFSATLSTFVMNGGTIFFDGPDQFPGSMTDDGLNGLDWEVGESGLGRFEMHNDAVFRAGDDLKVGANAAGHGTVLIDGNAKLSVGSGVSVSEGGPSEEQLMTVAGNALVEAGNSLGAGDPGGSTDEGYLTMASGGSTGRLIIQDNAVFNFRRLSARAGTSTIIVKDHGQLHIFDVFHGKGFIDANTPPDRPAETGPNSSYASEATAEGTFTLQDDAQMTVSSDPAAGPIKGLAIGGPRDAGNAGGKAALIVRDRASLSIVQNLELGTGAADSSDGTLTVIGPDAKITIGGNLDLAVDLNGDVTPGKGTVNPVITGATHAIINVSGSAKLANGTLKVKLDGYTPVGGETYTVIKGGTIEGEFLASDFSEATLGAGLTWTVEYAADAVRVKVQGGVTPPIVIDSPVRGTDTVTLTWTGGAGPFLVQGKMAIGGATWTDLVTTPDRTAKIPLVGGAMFLRVQDGATKTVKLYKAVLNGANERPSPVVTPATGLGLLALDGTTATYAVSYSGLTAASSAAHVHGPATPEEAKGVMFAIDGPIGPTAGLFSGVKTGLTAAQVTAIETGMTYFNIHTVGPNSGGEIRGQILAP